MATGSFSGSFYELYAAPTNLGWQGSQNACAAGGGHLATVSSQAENDFLASLLNKAGTSALPCNQPGQRVWLGFSDNVTEGDWRWVNGEAVVYTNWSPGEPNNATAGEDYAMMFCPNAGAIGHTPFTWNDEDDSQTHGYFCEFALPTFSCNGFDAPMADYPVTVRGNRALPLKAELFDADGLELTDLDFLALPVVQILFDSGDGNAVDVSEEALPAGQGDEGNQFVYTDEGKWQYNLKTLNYTAPGTYTVFMESGDDTEYDIDPSCFSQFMVK